MLTRDERPHLDVRFRAVPHLDLWQALLDRRDELVAGFAYGHHVGDRHAPLPC
jgi:hypothetical protein